jgi:drug/metabolite transporter (DMT)-like permease
VRARTAYALLLATVVLWALNFTVAKYILEHGFHPLAFAALRYGAAGLVFTAITVPRERALGFARADVPLVLACVPVLILNQLGFVYALRLTTAATVALIFGTIPIFTGALASAFGLERLGRRFWLASLVSFGGVALVALGEPGGLAPNVKGDALALLTAATWAAYSVVIAFLMPRYSPYRVSALVLLGVAVALVAAGGRQVATQSFSLDWTVWLAFAFAVLGPLVLTNVMWFTAIDRVGPSRAALFANLNPFLAAAIAVVALSERVTAVQVVGGCAIAAGIALARRRATRRAPQ